MTSTHWRRASRCFDAAAIIPMHPDAVRAMQRRLDGYRFADVYGYTWGRNVIGDACAVVDRSFARYFRAVGAAA